LSCYEWERGRIKLTCAEYAKFKKAFRDQWNASIMQAYERACQAQKALIAANKGKRNVNWSTAVDEYKVQTAAPAYGYSWTIPAVTLRLHELPHGRMIVNSMGYAAYAVENKRPTTPKKKDFPKATNKTTQFNAGEAMLSFDDKGHTVVWDVEENNHACERARESKLGEIFFKLLGKVVWGRGSGGTIIGNDEYNRDSGSEYAGGGGSYVKDAYGNEKNSRCQR